jgi:hypothetical protein
MYPSAHPLIQVVGPQTFALPQTAAGDNPYDFFDKSMLRARERRRVTGVQWSTV